MPETRETEGGGEENLNARAEGGGETVENPKIVATYRKKCAEGHRGGAARAPRGERGTLCRHIEKISALQIQYPENELHQEQPCAKTIQDTGEPHEEKCDGKRNNEHVLSKQTWRD